MAEPSPLDRSLSGLSVPAVAVDATGRIIATNAMWAEEADRRAGPQASVGVGCNYLSVCDTAVGKSCDGAAEAAAGIRAVLSGERGVFLVDYPCPEPDLPDKWVTLRVRAMDGGTGAILSHSPVTELRRAETTAAASGPFEPLAEDTRTPFFLTISAEGEVTYHSAMVAELTGGGSPAADLLEMVDANERDAVRACFERVRNGSTARERLVVHLRNRELLWRTLDLTVSSAGGDAGAGEFVVAGSDVSAAERRQIANVLQQSLLPDLPAAVVAVDERETVVYWNQRAERIWSRPASEVLGLPVTELGVAPVDPVVLDAIRGAVTGRGRWEGDYDARGPDGGIIPVHAVIEMIDAERLGIRGMVGTLTDISERRRMERMLEARAHTDPMTGLPNRLAFSEHLETVLSRERQPGCEISVILLDLDNFKAVNDAFGHDAGDSVLEVIADLIAAVLSPDDVLARIGGDEFAVCCERDGRGDCSSDVAAAIREVLAAPFSLGGQSIYITASLGIAVSGEDVTGEALLRDADIAVYEAKESGRNQVKIYDETLRFQRRRSRQVALDLDTALNSGQIVAFFQPEVSMADGGLLGFEALVRWSHPTKGLIAPNRFITIAEETGLIHRLGQMVMEQACAALAGWTSTSGRPLSMAVNVSARQLQRLDFAAQVRDAVERFGLQPRQLCIEITESTVAEIERSVEVLTELRSVGVTIALDDFGTGYSSLDRLRYLPIDYLKIDRTFVQCMLDDPDSQTIVAAIVRLAGALGIETIAEGVEEVEQAQSLQALGCRIGQGYLWGRPMPLADATALIGHGCRADHA